MQPLWIKCVHIYIQFTQPLIKCPLRTKNSKALDNITNLSEVVPREDKKQSVQDAKYMFPIIDVDTDVQSSKEISIPKTFICRTDILC